MGFQVNPDQDMVEVDGHAIPYEEKSVAIAFHKPVGVVSTCRISKEKGPAITDFLDLSYRLYPAGRLDRDSSGLVILTNDGDLALRITHPRYGKPKEYLVRLKSPLSRSSLAQLKRGISLEDGVIRPEKVWVLPDGMVGIIITEGRKRIVRRMFEALGNRVMALHRVRIGEVDLGNLGPGTWRYLTEQEVLSFLNRTKP
jgi:pseudouridine synthase